jgi:hypothetical protein
VYAVEASAMAKFSRKLVKGNKMDSVVEVIEVSLHLP